MSCLPHGILKDETFSDPYVVKIHTDFEGERKHCISFRPTQFKLICEETLLLLFKTMWQLTNVCYMAMIY